MINPISHFKNRLDKLSFVAEYGIRSAIHSARAQKLNQIDLRKYRGNPEKKARIRRLIFIQNQIAFQFLVNMNMAIMQPLPPTMKPGGKVIQGEGKPIDMPKLIINQKNSGNYINLN